MSSRKYVSALVLYAQRRRKPQQNLAAQTRETARRQSGGASTLKPLAAGPSTFISSDYELQLCQISIGRVDAPPGEATISKSEKFAQAPTSIRTIQTRIFEGGQAKQHPLFPIIKKAFGGQSVPERPVFDGGTRWPLIHGRNTQSSKLCITSKRIQSTCTSESSSEPIHIACYLPHAAFHRTVCALDGGSMASSHAVQGIQS